MKKLLLSLLCAFCISSTTKPMENNVISDSKCNVYLNSLLRIVGAGGMAFGMKTLQWLYNDPQRYARVDRYYGYEKIDKMLGCSCCYFRHLSRGVLLTLFGGYLLFKESYC